MKRNHAFLLCLAEYIKFRYPGLKTKVFYFQVNDGQNDENHIFSDRCIFKKKFKNMKFTYVILEVFFIFIKDL